MFHYPKRYDVIVVGGGHAGVEAALAAARMGCATLLLSTNLDTIGQMSCNPAIGGLAKGHLVREIDALGGEMGRNTDLTGIQFRMLNRTKGPSVWAPRAQCDKKAYQFRLKWVCERQPNLDCKQAQTTRLLTDGGMVIGVETSLGVAYHGQTVVVTTGTFLRGLMHIGSNQQPGGRSGEAASMSLSESLRAIGLELARLKTGTPPRLLKSSIRFDHLEVQPGDEPIPFLSYWDHDLFHVEHSVARGSGHYPKASLLGLIGRQLPCHITWTTPATEAVIRRNLHRSAMYSGAIEGVGPRYCPSIEDKYVKFPDKPRHQIFLEPEGHTTEEVYINGFSTSLPFEVQVDLVRTIEGCENAEIMRPAYAVEYDFVLPTQLYPSLETKICQGLFLAGQINGTSGYEEAGAQGLMAGINAARRVHSKEPVILRRDQAYIGVLIDDLVTKGTSEPYRMFTSRAEYRLLLRQDNADQRLSSIGYDIGSLPLECYQQFTRKNEAIQAELVRLSQTRVGNETLSLMLKRPGVKHSDLPASPELLDQEVVRQVEITLKYQGYVHRQLQEVDRFLGAEGKGIPRWIDYQRIIGLRTEARHKLQEIQPVTIGQASRISGITPADISLLLVWMKRGPRNLPIASQQGSACAAEDHGAALPGHDGCCGDL